MRIDQKELLKIATPKKYNQYQRTIKQPKKNLQVYITQETFNKMLERTKQMSLSEITEEALVRYLK